MIWTLLLLTSFAYAEDLAVERYCFQSSQKMSQVALRLKPILVPSDKLDSDANCFSVSMRSHRRELIQSFVRNIDPQVKISFSSAEASHDPCLLKIEKIKTLSSTQLNTEITNNPQIEQAQTNKEIKDTTSIQTLKDFEISVDQDVIKGTCRFITPTRYEITLEVRKDPRPLIPGLPEGSTVIVNQPVPPPNQETSKLNTSLQLVQGQRIEIGSTIKDLRSNSHKVDANNKELDLEKTDGIQSEKVYLSLE